MRKILTAVYYSFPVQLLILHLRKYQVLLIPWLILFGTVQGSLMHTFGADSLLLAPEYLENVSPLAAAIVGIALGIFVMSWNITTFILYSRQFRFLATTTQPFLRYCLNNAVLPLAFLIYYMIRFIDYNKNRELMPGFELFALGAGFIAGFVILLSVSFLYFFGANRTIMKRLAPVLSNPMKFLTMYGRKDTAGNEPGLLRVDWFFSTLFKIKKTRNVSHYSSTFIDSVFKQHNMAAIFLVFVAFVFLVIMGYLLDYRVFQLPAAASIILFFAIIIALSAAFSLFLQTWSVPVIILVYLFVNFLFKNNLLDFASKAYGLDYTNREDRPFYTRDSLLQLCNPGQKEADRKNMISILNKWKSRQKEELPVMFLINTSGGGNRSSTFTMNVLQRLDSLSGGTLMSKTFLITGASGGMLGAAYFRELYLRSLTDPSINLQNRDYVDDISKDLLNATFSSLVARDLLTPAQKFRLGNNKYIKDRAFSFEERLNDNTRGYLNKTLNDYKEDESNARIPLLFFNSVVTRDGKKMITSTQPVSFLMQATVDSNLVNIPDPDAIDFSAFFKNQNPGNLRILTALRMNATFPYVLPNVWLPTYPIVDVMDAGMRDNFGQETALRFVDNFRDWLDENTSAVVIINIRDRATGGWDQPFEANSISELFTKPAFLIQHNWFKLQDYYQNDQMSYVRSILPGKLNKVSFHYVPRKQDDGAALNFHLTKREKQDIAFALENPFNAESFKTMQNWLLRGGK
ncbi:MAG TPA: hypothetical protein VIK74_02790 [Parasegetibacter sp.]